mgnify:FL=1
MYGFLKTAGDMYNGMPQPIRITHTVALSPKLLSDKSFGILDCLTHRE